MFDTPWMWLCTSSLKVRVFSWVTNSGLLGYVSLLSSPPPTGVSPCVRWHYFLVLRFIIINKVIENNWLFICILCSKQQIRIPHALFPSVLQQLLFIKKWCDLGIAPLALPYKYRANRLRLPVADSFWHLAKLIQLCKV